MSLSEPTYHNIQPEPRLRQSLHERRLRKKRRSEVDTSLKPQPTSPYTPFFVPESLLDTDRSKDSQSRSPFFRLPNEILLLIVEHLAIPYFQVSFGLTCKKIASILAENRIRLSTWRGYCDKEGLYRLLVQPQRVRNDSTKEILGHNTTVENLSPTPSPVPAITSTTYIPSRLRLCRACFRHVPRDPIYWQRKMCSKEFEGPGVNWIDITNFFGEGNRNCGQHKCPDCCIKGHTVFVNERQYERALRDFEKRESCGIKMSAEAGESRICPQLNRRIGRP